MKKILSLILAVLMIAALTACSTATPTVESSVPVQSSVAAESSVAAASVAQPAAATEEKPLVGVVVEMLAGNAYQVAMADTTKALLDKMGYKYLFDAPQELGDFTQQIAIVEGMINKGIKILIMAPSNFQSLVPTLKAANEKGITVVLMDDEVGDTMDEVAQYQKDCGFATVVTPSSEVDAYNATKYLCEKIGGKGKVLNIEGAPGFKAATDRTRGFERALKEYPDVKVVATQTGGWTEEGGLKVAESIITGNPDLAGIFAANDNMAYGAIAALKAKNLKAVVVGIDADQRALDLVKSGEYAATVGASFNRMADWAVRCALAQYYYMKDGLKAVDGTAFQPFSAKLISGSVLVDSTNVDDFMKNER